MDPAHPRCARPLRAVRLRAALRARDGAAAQLSGVRRIVAAAAAAAIAAGCGGGSTRLSRSELAMRAGKICTEQAQKIAQIPRGPATAENAAGYTGAVLSVVEGGVKKFHRLKPPRDLDARYHAFLSELDHNIDVLRTIRAAAAARQRKDYVAGLSELHRSRVRIDTLERRLGFTGCAGTSGAGAG